MKNFTFTLILLISVLVVKAAGVRDLRVEYEHEPIGVDVARPRFSWQMMTDSTRRGQCQTAWSIIVKDDRGQTVWESGRHDTSESVGIEYGGAPLSPETAYEWQLTVWDERGRSVTQTSHFETGLMSNSNWSGARWIGSASTELPLYADYLPVFDIEFTLQLDRKSRSRRASVVYGANDPRLSDINKNLLGITAGHDESYIRIELDATGDTACINVFRSMYSAKDLADVPLKSLRVPVSIINASNRYSPHTLRIASVLGTTDVFIDNSVKAIGRIELNPMGVGGDFIAFPVLGDFGFMVPEGQKARFTDVRVRNYRSPKNIIKTLAADTLVTGTDRISTFKIHGNAEPMLRTEFSTDESITRARLYVTARGAYRFFINGSPVGHDYLNPGQTQYNRTHVYHVYDVTPMLHTGRNALGAQLSEGWWRGGATFVGSNWNVFGDRSSILAKLVITYSDGTTATVVTNPDTWQSLDSGPLLSGSLFQGEVFDSRRAAELEGWSTAGYSARDWNRAAEIPTEGNVSTVGDASMPRVDDFSNMRLISLPGNAIRAVDTLKAVSVKEVRPGVFVYDMGQNMAGVPDITFRGLRPGTEVCMRFAEVLYPELPEYKDREGTLMLENIRAAMAQDIYIARGGEEVFSPHHTYHGYRYVELSGLTEALPLESVRGCVISSVHDFTADYVTSNDTLNRLFKNVEWSMRANFMSVPTDCPQRNERMGWSGDISVFSPSAVYLARVPQFLSLHTEAMRDVQSADGRFPDIAPVGGGFGGILWGSAGIIVPWQNFVQFGDRGVLRDSYESMSRYINYIMDKETDPSTGIIVQQRSWGDLADWLGPEDNLNDKSLLWEAYFIHDLDIMKSIAKVLGRTDDETRFSCLAAERRDFFNRTYIDPVTAKTVWSAFDENKKGRDVDTQTSYVLPLEFNIVTDSLKERFAGNLAATVSRSRVGFGPYSLLTGFIGTAWVCRVLSDIGHPDMAYKLLLNTDYPSWLYPVTQGATTIWERLNSYTRKDGFGGNNRMNSFNHYSFGAVVHWLMSRSLGIERKLSSPAFSSFELRPEADSTGKLKFARGHYDSMYGRIESSWQRNSDGTIRYDFTVPANTTADLVLKGRRLKGKTKGVKFTKAQDGTLKTTLQSGRYSFVVE